MQWKQNYGLVTKRASLAESQRSTRKSAIKFYCNETTKAVDDDNGSIGRDRTSLSIRARLHYIELKLISSFDQAHQE